MRSHRKWVSGALTCAALAVTAAVVKAQDEEAPETFDVRALVEQSEAAQRVPGVAFTIRLQETGEASQTLVLPDGSMEDSEETEASDVLYVERHEESADARTRTVHIVECSLTQDAIEDTTLTGRTFLIAGAEWSERGGEDELTAIAREWVTDDLADDPDDPDEHLGDTISDAMLPDRPLAIGERWEVDGEALMSEFNERLEGKLTVERIEGWGRLIDVRRDADGAADEFDIEVHIEAPIGTIGSGAQVLTAAEGSKIEASFTGRASAQRGTRTMDGDFSVDLTVELPGGATMAIGARAVQHEEVEQGGEIPALQSEPDDPSDDE